MEILNTTGSYSRSISDTSEEGVVLRRAHGVRRDVKVPSLAHVVHLGGGARVAVVAPG